MDMDRINTPGSMQELIAALADGELDLRDHAEALQRLIDNDRTARLIAEHHQLKRSVSEAMTGQAMACPDALAARLHAMALTQDAQGGVASDLADSSLSLAASAQSDLPATRPAPAYHGTPVLARIGRWAPAAVAAVLLLAATVMFMQAGGSGAGSSAGVASLLSVKDVERFDSRHAQCAADPQTLHRYNDFGKPGELEQLPIKLGDYFKTSPDGMQLNLSGVGYDYQLTGLCALPGKGAVHIVYRHHDQPGRAISLWLAPDDGRLDNIDPDRVYVEAGKTLDHPVIVWRSGGLIYYLLGDSLEDAHHAVDSLRNPV